VGGGAILLQRRNAIVGALHSSFVTLRRNHAGSGLNQEARVAGARDVSSISGTANLAAKLKGIAFGQDVMLDGGLKHTLYVANDHDFSAVVPNSHHADGGADNPNRFFVFGFDDDDLPGFVRQEFRRPRAGREHDGRDVDGTDRDF
jgi:hypothetical protein